MVPGVGGGLGRYRSAYDGGGGGGFSDGNFLIKFMIIKGMIISNYKEYESANRMEWMALSLPVRHSASDCIYHDNWINCLQHHWTPSQKETNARVSKALLGEHSSLAFSS